MTLDRNIDPGDGGQPDWIRLVRSSIVQPREAARLVVGWQLPTSVLVEAAVAVSCLGAVVTWFAAVLMPGEIDPLMQLFGALPLLVVMTQLLNLVVICGLITVVGRLCGGHGTLHGAFTAVIWINAVMVLLQLAQTVLVFLLPQFAILMSFLLFNWLIWCLSVFVAELHGFRNIIAVTVLVFLTAVVMTFALISMLSGLGMVPQGVGDV